MRSRTFKPDEPVDFVVVGSGVSGGTIARELSRQGFTVLVFEQGPRMGPADFEHDEFKYFMLNGIINDPKYAPQTFRNSADVAAETRPGPNPLMYARIVGGSSNHFTANFWRFNEIDFHERSLYGSIAGTSFADWPITYQELEPYYTKVDWEVGISGLAGASPHESPRSRPYPMPPLPVKSSGVLFERGARKLGLHPFPAPMAVASRPFKDRPACIHCGFCMGFGCEARAKSSALYTVIPEAEATGRCEIRPLSYVYHVDTDDKGRATGVHYFDAAKQTHFQPARAVVLSANGAETARLLLNSTSNRFPQGLANSSGLVGKNLMFNQNGSVQGQFEHELNEYKSVQVSRILFDFYKADPKRGFYGGGGIDARINPQPALWAMNASGDLPRWGAALKERLEAFTHVTASTGHSTSLPLESNSVSIDPKLKDAWGIPAMRLTYRDHPDDLKFVRFLQDRSYEILDAAGAKKIWREDVHESSGGVHLLGTARMGNDAKASVVDKYHRTHDVKNLFVCDGSSFVTSGRGQPTMTIWALAFRAGEHIGRFAKNNEV